MVAKVPTESDFNKAERTLKALVFNPQKRKRILNEVRKKTLRQSRSNVRRQKSPDGKSWPKRKNGNEKMMKNMLKAKHLRVMNDGFQLSITYKNKLTGQIARRQQEGIPETVTAEQYKKRMPKPNYDAPATKQQAQALRDVGFQIVRRSGVGQQQPSNRWVVENLTQGQAGAIYRTLSNSKPKSKWEVKTPSRPFLGLTDKQAERILISEILKTES